MAKNYNPKNVDLLNIGRACDLNCIHCYYREKVTVTNHDIARDMDIASRVLNNFPDSSIFVYPMEIANNMEIISLLLQAGQKSVLSNGILLNERMLDLLLVYGIEEIKITLFSNFREHNFFCGIGSGQYEDILKNIQLCKQKGLKVVVNFVLSKITKKSIPELAKICSGYGVDKIEFLRLKPTGNARKISHGILIGEKDMLGIVQSVERCKADNPEIYFRYNLSCGPDFYGKSIEGASAKIRKASMEWTKSKYLCPAIDGNYLGISVRSGKIYSCFFAQDQAEFLVGKMDLQSGAISHLEDFKLDSSTLSEKLRGNCHKDSCLYQEICLGGCRSTALIFAKERGELDPMFAGMDICITKCKEKLKM